MSDYDEITVVEVVSETEVVVIPAALASVVVAVPAPEQPIVVVVGNAPGATGVASATVVGVLKGDGLNIVEAVAGIDFVAPNAAIVAGTGTKVTYDTKGLVTSSTSATTADIADSADKRYCTDAQKVVVAATSNTNTGDETESTIKTKLGITTLSGSNTGDVTISTANGLSIVGQALSLQAATNSVPGALSAADHTTFAAKEPAITAGTTAQYLRGDKSLATFATDALAAAPAETATTIKAILDSTTLDKLTFNTSPPAQTFVEGKTYYDSTLKTLDVMVNGDVILPIGQEEMVLCYNNTGATIAYGQVVYPTGAYGGYPTIALAMADTDTTSLLIGVTTQTIAVGSTGFVTNRGTVRRVDTSGYVTGDTLYLSTSVPGGLTKIPTVDPTKRLIRVAVALDISATVGSIYVRYVLNNRVSDMSDVLLGSPTVGDSLAWNGSMWVNQNTSQVSAGAGVNLYLDDTATIDGYGTLSRTPIIGVEHTDSVVCNSNTVFCEGYLYNLPQNRTEWDAGTWKCNMWSYVSATTGVSELITGVYMVEYYGGYGGTVAITGSGTSRTATVTGTTPFVAGDANANVVLASYVQTPLGTFQITAFTSDSVVTIATTSGYVNETGVTFAVHNYKFQMTTGEINQTGSVALYTMTSVQAAYACPSLNTTIAARMYGKTTSGANITISFTHNGSEHYSHIETPFLQRHNDLPGEQGGSATERYHLTAAQHGHFAANTFTIGDGLTGSKQLIFDGVNDGTIAWDSTTQAWNFTTGVVTASGFSGPLTGNVTGNTSGSSGTCTGNAGTVTNATLTTALTVDTGTVAIHGNAANTSALTLGAGAVSVSGTNTGDQPLPTDATIVTTDVTTNDVSTSKHGWFPKLPAATGKYLKDDLTWGTPSGGAGDVVGPASAVGDHVVLFDSTTGKLIKDSGAALPVKATGAEVTTGTDDAKFTTPKALVDAGNVLAATVQTLTNKSIYLPDGEGLNYTLVPSIASSNLTVSLKTFAGTNPSATDVSIFSIGAVMLSVSAELLVDVPAALGDIFAWDAGKIQDNDAQLFVYLINNNGTPQIGVSPCPTLLTVATNYYSNGSQTGAAGHTNMVMSGTRNATNSCRVIGRINVNQLDNNNWQAPTTSLVVNKAIYATDWLTWTPTYTGFSTPPTSFLTLYKLDRETVSLISREYPAGTSNGTDFTKTAPILSKNVTNMAWVGWLFTAYDAGVVFSPPGEISINFNTQSLYLCKVPGNSTSWTASGEKRAQIMNFVYQVS